MILMIPIIISIIIVFLHVNLTCSSFGEGVPYEGREDKARVNTVSLKSESEKMERWTSEKQYTTLFQSIREKIVTWE